MSRRPSAALAVGLFQSEQDPDRAWAVFQRVLESGVWADVRFFHAMMAFCKRCAPMKAPDVMAATVSQRIPVPDVLFCTFLAACQKADPPLTREAFDLYRNCGPRSHNSIFGVANLCRVSGQPALALSLVSDAIDNNVEFSEALLSLFAACCAESQCGDGADTAGRLLERVRSGSIAPPRNYPLFANLITALLSQGGVDPALRALDVMDSVGMPPSMPIYTNVLSGAIKAGRLDDALNVFRAMTQRGCSVDGIVFTSLVSLCGRNSNMPAVESLYAHARDRALLVGNQFVACAFVSAFDRCGKVDLAEDVYGKVPSPDPATVTSMISAYCRHDRISDAISIVKQMESFGAPAPVEAYNAVVTAVAKSGRTRDALDLFQSMVDTNLKIDEPMFACLIAACGRCRDLPSVHRLYRYARVENTPLMGSDVVVSAFVSGFSNCCHLDAAQHAFESSRVAPTVATYNAMIAAYCHQGQLSNATNLFAQMRSSRIDPSSHTLSSLLSGCAHVGDAACADAFLSDFARQWSFPLLPSHLTHIVDLQGRAGNLDIAERIASASSGSLPWVTFLTACIRRGDIPHAERAFARILAMDNYAASYACTLMLNMYGHAGQDSTASRLMTFMEARGIARIPDRTTLLLDDQCPSFEGGHSCSRDHTRLIDRALAHGYTPDLTSDADQTARQTVFQHSEKLAIAFSLAAGGTSPIRLARALPTCPDCHNFMKVVSSVYARDIFVRNGSRCHHFHNGRCSCADYW
ncbi:unnamed protein product (mitochondrion) [Plasmodiophora brassicae]|uniref:Uncharacterized protein n=1 Tax=Plasmodiophora brassicae TaxID=37360 RepID=A0A0G4IX71_PLABS|nr:hypothetical protein PBRA_007664 [Plasmodiophora brassicae]SPQ99562.1 unnamed protein product [Plasmodiophora brassicae]